MKSDELVRTFDEHALKGFEGTVVWQAFMVTVEERIDLIRSELETGVVVGNDGKPVLISFDGIKKRQGECESLRYILALPETIRQVWAQDAEIKEKKKEE